MQEFTSVMPRPLLELPEETPQTINSPKEQIGALSLAPLVHEGETAAEPEPCKKKDGCDGACYGCDAISLGALLLSSSR